MGSSGQWGIQSEIFDGRQIRCRSQKHFLEMTLLPSSKRHIATPSLKGICDNLPRALYQLSLKSVPASTSHLSPFTSTEGHRGGASTASAPDLLPRRPLPPHRSYFPGGHYLHTGAASPLATTSTPELLPLRPLPPHRICFTVGQYLRIGSASPSTTTSAPELLPP